MTTIEKRIAAGLCRDCGDGPPRAGRRCCEPCAAAQRVRVKAGIERKKAQGMVQRWVMP